MQQPTTLIEAIRYYSDTDTGLEFLSMLRWPDGAVICPNCSSPEVRFLSTRKLWECKSKHAKRQFSIKVGTIFEDSPIGLDKWLPACWMIFNDKNGVSSHEMARALGVTQKTAWFMLQRIRLAMQTGTFARRLAGDVEVDETFIGGKARFMHRDKRAAKIKRTGGMGKTAVMGLLERHGPDGHSTVRASVIASRRRSTLVPAVRENVEAGATVYTDALKSYVDLSAGYVHEVIDHAEEYARGAVHTNGIENFWSLLKRSLKGTYVSVEPFHLFRYLDEQAFRYNNRETNDAGRFVRGLRAIIGKRLTYAELTGKLETRSA